MPFPLKTAAALLCLIAAPASAQAPLSPHAAFPSSKDHHAWVEPPANSAPSDAKKPALAMAEPTGPEKTPPTATRQRTAQRYSARRHYARSGLSRDHMANLLNRRSLGGWYGGGYGYGYAYDASGYGPRPNGGTGN